MAEQKLKYYSKKFKGTLEDLISDLDDVFESYALLVNGDHRCYIYEPDDIDTVYPEQLGRKVEKFIVKEYPKGVVVDVYLS